MSTVTIKSSGAQRMVNMKNWDTPWLNSKFIIGSVMVLSILLMGFLGPIFWNIELAHVGTSPLNLPPIWAEHPFFQAPSMDHPLGTESSGRDMLASLLTGAPRSFQIGLIAASVGMGLGVILGFTAGFIGGWVDNVIRTLADSVMTIPVLAILIVISSYVRQVEISTMALILGLFAWAGPTRLIRAQVLTMKERGYIRMAHLCGASTLSIMFKEMLPNMLPYLAASFAGMFQEPYSQLRVWKRLG